MSHPRVSLEQWHTLHTVVDYGGFAQAAEKLHRSQSSVSYAIRQLEQRLGAKVFEVQGRKAVLTETGVRILERSRSLLEDAGELETMAHQISQGWESRLRLVIDSAFPTQLLAQALQEFAPLSHGTPVLLTEVIMSGADDLANQGQADLVVGYQLPTGRLGKELIQIPFLAVAHPEHPVNKLGRDVTASDLRKHRQVVVSDSGETPHDSGWLSAAERWTVSSLQASLNLVANRMGYAWLPYHIIQASLQQRDLQIIPLQHGRCYHVTLYSYFGQHHSAGPAAKILAELFSQITAQYQPSVDIYL